MPNIGLPEIAIVLIIVLVIFGPKRLPDLGRSLGRGMREFKDSVTGQDKDERELPSGESSTDTDTAPRAETSESEPAPAVTAPDKRP